MGVALGGVQCVPGNRAEDAEGASSWAHVCAGQADLSAREMLLVCCSGKPGLPEASEAAWPDSLAQTCVVHLIRASMRFVSCGDRTKGAAELRKIHTAPNKETALATLAGFETTWTAAWQRTFPFLQFPRMLLRIIPTTNSIESVNFQLRKVTKNRL